MKIAGPVLVACAISTLSLGASAQDFGDTLKGAGRSIDKAFRDLTGNQPPGIETDNTDNVEYNNDPARQLDGKQFLRRTFSQDSEPAVQKPAEQKAPVQKSTGRTTAGAGNSASRQTVYDIQRSLTELGYATGGADGIMGPNTRRAIRQYQADQRLLIDGVPSEPLLAHIRERLSR